MEKSIDDEASGLIENFWIAEEIPKRKSVVSVCSIKREFNQLVHEIARQLNLHEFH